MSAVTPVNPRTYPIICVNCGDRTGDFTTERSERMITCDNCQNLPSPWQVGTTEPDGDYDNPEPEDDRPMCRCGSMQFVATEIQEITYDIDTRYYDPDDGSRLYIPSGHGDIDTTEVRISCHRCGAAWHDDYEWS